MGYTGRTETIIGYCVIEGPVRIKLIDGFLEVTGKTLSVGEEVIVPSAKATLLESPSGAKVELRGAGSLVKLESSTIPKEWLSFINSLPNKNQVVYVLGCVDSGKTFFVTYTANKLLARGLKVSIIDCDTGQSDVGPPTTIGLGILNKQVTFLEEVPLTSAYFVGSTSPTGHLLPMVTGTLKLVDKAKKLGDIVLIDTPGMVHGGPARAYQFYTVEVLNPEVIVALQRSDELGHLIRQFKALGYEVVQLPASLWVRQRDRMDRRALRERAFYNYFSRRGLVTHIMSLDRVVIVGSFIGSGSVANPEVIRVVESMAGCKVEYCEISQDSVVIVLEEKPKSRDLYANIRSAFSDKIVRVVVKGFERGLVVGLMSKRGEFLDIGVLRGIDFKNRRVTVATPLREANQVKAIKLGCVKLGEEYQEIEKLEPGFI